MTDRPVIMVVWARITDRDAYADYMAALISSGLFDRYGATPLATGPVRNCLEGDIASNDIAALVEFPSEQAATAFWNSEDYSRIAGMREGAGDFKVGLWRRLPSIGDRIEGRVKA